MCGVCEMLRSGLLNEMLCRTVFSVQTWVHTDPLLYPV